MKREIATAMLLLPIGMTTLLPKSALAIEKRFTPNLNQTNQPVLVADRDDDDHWDNNRRYDDRWDNNRRYDGRWDNNHRDNDRWDNNHHYNDRWDNNHRDNWQNNNRYYNQYGSRKVWIPGHWESGFLGIGRKWVEGHWDYRR